MDMEWRGLINTNSAFGADWLPGLDVGYRAAPSALIYASADRCSAFPPLRICTTISGGARGSADLQPEYSVNLNWVPESNWLSMLPIWPSSSGMVGN